MKNKRGKVKHIYTKSTDLTETITEIEKNINSSVHIGINHVTHLINKRISLLKKKFYNDRSIHFFYKIAVCSRRHLWILDYLLKFYSKKVKSSISLF